ncbi:hypothetical protein O9K51_02685 [Purpureocillium lavendulum]|uniref:Uncharacterized protein n=1 Tax=Purpureocillium lavendulum TaxID=1247861 RepID=A0AB34G096_9HYPO|nr:hypothetical protein O9K51_02685 [Purpureocillium lavendulum]
MATYVSDPRVAGLTPSSAAPILSRRLQWLYVNNVAIAFAALLGVSTALPNVAADWYNGKKLHWATRQAKKECSRDPNLGSVVVDHKTWTCSGFAKGGTVVPQPNVNGAPQPNPGMPVPPTGAMPPGGAGGFGGAAGTPPAGGMPAGGVPPPAGPGPDPNAMPM